MKVRSQLSPPRPITMLLWLAMVLWGALLPSIVQGGIESARLSEAGHGAVSSLTGSFHTAGLVVVEHEPKGIELNEFMPLEPDIDDVGPNSPLPSKGTSTPERVRRVPSTGTRVVPSRRIVTHGPRAPPLS